MDTKNNKNNEITFTIGDLKKSNIKKNDSSCCDNIPTTTKPSENSKDFFTIKKKSEQEEIIYKSSNHNSFYRNSAFFIQGDRTNGININKTSENFDYLGKSCTNLSISHCSSIKKLNKENFIRIKKHPQIISQIKDFESENEVEEERNHIEHLDSKNTVSWMKYQDELNPIRKNTYVDLNEPYDKSKDIYKTAKIKEKNNQKEIFYDNNLVNENSSLNNLHSQTTLKKTKIIQKVIKIKPQHKTDKTTKLIDASILTENKKLFSKNNNIPKINLTSKNNISNKIEKILPNPTFNIQKDSVNKLKIHINKKQVLISSKEKVDYNKNNNNASKSKHSFYTNNNLNTSFDKSTKNSNKEKNDNINKGYSKFSSSNINKDKIDKLVSKTQNKSNIINNFNDNNSDKACNPSKVKIESYLTKGKNQSASKKIIITNSKERTNKISAKFNNTTYLQGLRKNNFVDENKKETIFIRNKQSYTGPNNLNKINIHKKTFSASKIKNNFKDIKSRFLKHFDMKNMNTTINSNCNLEININELKELIHLPKKIKSISNFLKKSGTIMNIQIPKLRIDSVNIFFNYLDLNK